MIMHVFGLVLVGLMGVPPEPAHGAPEAAVEGLRVTLTPSKPQYTLGEPVVLDLAVENTGQKVLVTWHHSCIDQAVGLFFFALEPRLDEPGIRSVQVGPQGSFFTGPCLLPLEPGARKRYRWRVLIEDYLGTATSELLEKLGRSREISDCARGPWRLVCDRPGEYAALARYLHWAHREPRRARMLLSNPVTFRVRSPDGRSIEVFERIRHNWRFLGFLQFYTPDAETADLAVELLTRYPGSAYESAVRAALRYYYAHGNRHASESMEGFARRRRIIRELLHMPQWGIYDVLEDRYHEPRLRFGERPLFPHDHRLDQEREITLRNCEPIERLMSRVSPEGRIRVAPALEGRYELVVPEGVTSIRDSVRGFMQRATPPGTKWVTDTHACPIDPATEAVLYSYSGAPRHVKPGEGYVLVAEPEEQRETK